MFDVGHRSARLKFRLVITDGTSVRCEHVLAASSEREAFEVATRFTRTVVGEASTSSAFMLDANRAFLGNIDTAQSVRECADYAGR